MKWLRLASVTFFACGAVLLCLSLVLVPQNGFADDPGGSTSVNCSLGDDYCVYGTKSTCEAGPSECWKGVCYCHWWPKKTKCECEP